MYMRGFARGFTLDLRRHELTKLSDHYGKKAFKCYEKQAGEQSG
jgi:hypothetical protein